MVTSVSARNDRLDRSLVHIEHVAIGSVHPNPKNPRTHSRNQRRRLKNLIAKLGFINPIIVDEFNVILAGHGRHSAAFELGLSTVPIIRLTHLSSLEKRAYIIADNKIAEDAGWDLELLTIELGELVDLLPSQGLDIDLTAFEIPEIDTLLDNFAKNSSEPADELPPPTDTAVTRKGELWGGGPHRLLCGDAQIAKNFDRLMNGKTAAAVCCDPPYNVLVSSIVGRGRKKHEEFAFASGEMSSADFRKFLTKTLGNGIRVSKAGAVHYVFMDWRHIADLIEVGRSIYDAMLNLVVWNKTNAGQGSFYRSQHELIGVFRVGDVQHRNNVELGKHGRNRSNVWTYAGINAFGAGRDEALRLHPTVKPIALVADALRDCTSRGDIVLDQFMGSGTTMLAAEKIGRIAYGMEYEPRFVDVAIRRWQAFTKRDAILEGDGRTFDEIAAERVTIPEAPSLKGRRPSTAR